MGITEDQRKQYEEAAKKAYSTWYDDYTQGSEMRAFIKGCEYAHSKIEEAERAILSDVFTIIENHQTLSMDDAEYKALEAVIEELKKLRK